mmetsp:Transcript_8603/g.8940  ORF Transcript_8603/g.8940 Transcript_8603/m.8940 type:complete len:576 (+) Transcript_8603:69-1796(+)
MKRLFDILLIALLFVSFNAKSFKPVHNVDLTNLIQTQSKTKGTWPANYFDGFWKAEGYGCFGQGNNIKEEGFGESKGGEFLMTKTVGDNCVTTGHLTFRGPLPTGEFSDSVGCTGYSGSPANPNSSTQGSCNINIIDQNTFKIWNKVTYRRGRNFPATYFPEHRLDRYPQSYFLGYWIGDGYTCNTGGTIPEDVNITYQNNEFTATKVNGDDCVNAGQITFRHPLQDEWIKIKSNDWNINKCKITLGNPRNPQSSTRNCWIFIDDINHFKVNNWKLTFRRGALEPREKVSYPHEYFLGDWEGLNYKCEGQTLTQMVRITYNNWKFIAVMIKGNDCVQKDQISFDGFHRPKYERNVESPLWDIGCILTIGTKAKPQSDYNPNCLIQIVDNDTFKLYPQGMTFTRKTPPKDDTTVQPVDPSPTPSPTPTPTPTPETPTTTPSLPVTHDAYPYDYFKGKWIGSGYTCLNRVGFLDEEVNIEYKEGEFFGVKILGDDCVESGKVSFRGILEDEYKQCEGSYHIPCVMNLGIPGAPENSYSTTCRVEILDLDTFKIPQWNLIFRRRECYKGKKPEVHHGA